METAAPHLEKIPLPPTAWPAVWAVLVALAAIGTALATAITRSPVASPFLPTLLFVVCILAAWFDAGTGRIPNSLTYMAIALGLGLNLVGALLTRAHHYPQWLGATNMSDCLLGFGILATAGIIALLIAQLGGGDMKLIVSIGAMLGISQAIPVVFWGLSAAIVYALFNIILRGKLNLAMQALSLNLLTLLYLQQPSDIQALPKSKMPLALPMALGIIASHLYPLGVFSA
jgi:prepilin peptidase CpaA